jgi:tRNA A22 N-methylase
VYLVLSGKCSQAIATDIRSGPLESAKGTLKKYRVTQNIKLIHTDGLKNVPPHGITDVVMAGMGGETIRDILAAPEAKWLQNGISLVLQPMTKAEVLRRWLAENGFAVRRENVVKDTKIYCVMQVQYTGEKRTVSEAEAFCGTLKRSELLPKIYIADVQKHLMNKVNGLEEAGKPAEADAVRALMKEINRLTEP